MSFRFLLFAIAIAPWLVAAPAEAGTYVCSLPRALLCTNCARDLTISLMPSGACRVSFTVGAPSAPDAQRMALHLTVQTAAAVNWRPRAAKKPAESSPTQAGNCFVFNGSRYCE